MSENSADKPTDQQTSKKRKDEKTHEQTVNQTVNQTVEPELSDSEKAMDQCIPGWSMYKRSFIKTLEHEILGEAKRQLALLPTSAKLTTKIPLSQLTEKINTNVRFREFATKPHLTIGYRSVPQYYMYARLENIQRALMAEYGMHLELGHTDGRDIVYLAQGESTYDYDDY
jgi:hypothetical protein